MLIGIRTYLPILELLQPLLLGVHDLVNEAEHHVFPVLFVEFVEMLAASLLRCMKVPVISIVLIVRCSSCVGCELHVHLALRNVEAAQVTHLSEGELQERVCVHKVELHIGSLIHFLFISGETADKIWVVFSK